MKHPHRDFVIAYSDMWLAEWEEQEKKRNKIVDLCNRDLFQNGIEAD